MKVLYTIWQTPDYYKESFVPYHPHRRAGVKTGTEIIILIHYTGYFVDLETASTLCPGFILHPILMIEPFTFISMCEVTSQYVKVVFFRKYIFFRKIELKFPIFQLP